MPLLSRHSKHRREVGIRTQLPSVDVRTDCAPLKKVRGEGLTFQSQSETLWYLCIPKGVPPRGQTSINQFLFEKSILDDAFHNVVNDAVNDVIAIATPRDAPVSDGR